MSVKSRHSSTKKEKIRKKEKRKKVEESEEDIESSEEELDLTKECHPIGYYMNDRHEMINQMFSVIKGNKLKAMLPPALKDLDLEYLKLQCLDQLLGMSEKRIQCILEGEILDTSSESEVPDSDDNESDEKNGTSSGSSSEKMNESHDEEKSANGSANRRKKRRSNSTSEGKSKVQKVDAENPPEKGKTLLEILELEMRARAIRALLKQGGNENAVAEEATNQNGDKEVSGEVVDLTECEDEELPIPPRKEKPESDIDKKVSKFEEKIEKSKEKVNNSQEDEKAKRLQAELELRNKLFKKKIYRTRQQRMENDEEEKAVVKQEIESEENSDFNNVIVKEEPKEPEDIVIEDPEEGEVSTSEDEYPVEIKQEPVEPVQSEIEPEPEPEPEQMDYEPKIDAEGERLAAMDNGAFVMNENVDLPTDFFKDTEESQNSIVEEKIPEETTETMIQEPSESSNLEPEKEPEQICEETSWRERWLKKDGVQKLVKSSKIFAKVKKRIAEKSHKSKEEALLVPSEINSDSSNSNFKFEAFEGSIEEYERLTGRSIDKSRESEKSKEEIKAEEPKIEVLKEAQQLEGQDLKETYVRTEETETQDLKEDVSSQQLDAQDLKEEYVKAEESEVQNLKDEAKTEELEVKDLKEKDAE